MLLVAGSPSLRRAALDQLAAARSPRYADALDDVRAGRSSSGTACCARSARRGRRATSCASGTRASSRPAARSSAHRLAAARRPRPGRSRAAHAEIAPDEAAADRGLGLRYVDERPGTPRRVATGRPGATARRDGRQGGLERLDAGRSAPRRPRLRARRPGPRRLRVARPAADRDPRVQARRARPPDRAGRAAAAPAARRRLLRARSRTAGRTSSAGSPSCRRRSSRRRPWTTSTRPCVPIATSWEVGRRPRTARLVPAGAACRR